MKKTRELHGKDERKRHFVELFCSYIAEDDENFSIIKFDPNRIHWAQVLINIKLKYTEAIVDRTEQNTLIVTMKIKVNQFYCVILTVRQG